MPVPAPGGEACPLGVPSAVPHDAVSQVVDVSHNAVSQVGDIDGHGYPEGTFLLWQGLARTRHAQRRWYSHPGGMRGSGIHHGGVRPWSLIAARSCMRSALGIHRVARARRRRELHVGTRRSLLVSRGGG